jgi:hypothetical protein
MSMVRIENSCSLLKCHERCSVEPDFQATISSSPVTTNGLISQLIHESHAGSEIARPERGFHALDSGKSQACLGHTSQHH